MVQRGESLERETHDFGMDLPWVGCAESHASQTPWNLILCEDLDDLPVVAHCAACGALLGTECCVGEGENGSDWQCVN